MNNSRYQWFAFLADDTFLIAENLRYFLSILDIEKYSYIGRPVKQSFIYHDLKSGIIINRKTLKKLFDHLWQEKSTSDLQNVDTDETIKKETSFSIVNQKTASNKSSHTTKVFSFGGLKRKQNCLFIELLDVALGRCLMQVGIQATMVDAQWQHSFTNLHLGLYLSNFEEKKLYLSFFSDLFFGKSVSSSFFWSLFNFVSY